MYFALCIDILLFKCIVCTYDAIRPKKQLFSNIWNSYIKENNKIVNYCVVCRYEI